MNSLAKSLNRQSVLIVTARGFTGKTESGFKFKTPKMRMRVVRPVYPPPGLNLQIPEGMTPEVFCKQIGGDCAEYADKFESMDEIFNFDGRQFREKGLPPVQRKYIMRNLSSPYLT